MFNVVTYSEAIKHYTLRMQMLMIASKDYSLGNVQLCRQKCFFFFFPISGGIFNAAVLRGTASMILLSLPQRHFLFYRFFICQVGFKLQIYMRKPQCTDF